MTDKVPDQYIILAEAFGMYWTDVEINQLLMAINYAIDGDIFDDELLMRSLRRNLTNLIKENN
jgi:hypothetical protein